jgi:hypothetical protein
MATQGSFEWATVRRSGLSMLPGSMTGFGHRRRSDLRSRMSQNSLEQPLLEEWLFCGDCGPSQSIQSPICTAWRQRTMFVDLGQVADHKRFGA